MTANRRLEHSWSARTSGSLIAAVAAHAMILSLWPKWKVLLPKPAEEPAGFIQLVPIPPRDASIDSEVAEEATAPRPMRIEGNGDESAEELERAKHVFREFRPVSRYSLARPIAAPPNPARRHAVAMNLERIPAVEARVTGMIAPTAWPQISNPETMRRYLRSRYNSHLEDGGATGTVIVSLWVDERGAVQHVRVNESSGVAILDEIALELFREAASFRPARDGVRALAVQFTVAVPFADAW
jgi:TonB family protein